MLSEVQIELCEVSRIIGNCRGVGCHAAVFMLAVDWFGVGRRSTAVVGSRLTSRMQQRHRRISRSC